MNLLLGLFLLLVSFLPWYFTLPPNLHLAGYFSIIWGAGYLLVCNHVIGHFKSKKTPTVNLSKNHVLFVGLLAALVIEMFGNWIWKLWYYPLFSAYLYLVTMPFILVVYFYFILRGYLAARAFLASIFRQPAKISIRRKSFPRLFKALGIVGALGIVVAVFQAIGLAHYNNIQFFNSYGVKSFQFFNISLLTVSVLSILEYLEYREREDTFLIHFLEGDWIPLLSIVIASTVTAFSMELFNLPLNLWQYTNWPYQHITLLGIPVVILLAWPVQYLLVVSVYRAMYKRETARIWD